MLCVQFDTDSEDGSFHIFPTDTADFCVAPRSFTPVVAKKRLGYKVRDGRMEKKRKRKESRGQEKSAGSSLRRVHAKKKITGEREGKAKEEGKSKGQAVPTSTLSLQALLPTHKR